MGVYQYEKDGRTLFGLDVWLRLPNGQMKRVRQKKITTQKHAKMLLAKLEIDAFEGRFFDRQLEAKITVEDCWKAWEPITTRDNDTSSPTSIGLATSSSTSANAARRSSRARTSRSTGRSASGRPPAAVGRRRPGPSIARSRCSSGASITRSSAGCWCGTPSPGCRS